MTPTELWLGGALLAALSAGGGIWIWGKDKVSKHDCYKEHEGVTKALTRIEGKVDGGFKDLASGMNEFRCSVKNDLDSVQSRVTTLQDRIAHVEGRHDAKV